VVWINLWDDVWDDGKIGLFTDTQANLFTYPQSDRFLTA